MTTKLTQRLKRILKVKAVPILVILLGLLLSSFINVYKIYADNFYSSGGDISECKMAFTAGLQINTLPSGAKFSYDPNLVVGERNGWIQNHKFTDTGTYLYPNAHRYTNVAGEVRVPPNTAVDLGLFFANFSGHNINLGSDSTFFVSKQDRGNGNIGNLTTNAYSDLSANWKAFGTNYSRVGSGFNFGGFSIPSNEGNGFGKVVHTLTTIQPMNIFSQNITYRYDGSALILDYSVIIANQSNYFLPAIKIRDFNPTTKQVAYEQEFNFGPKETKQISYSINLGLDYPLNITTVPLEVTDPNTHTESMVKTGPTTDRDTLNVFVKRNDSNAPNSYLNQSVTSDTSNRGDYLKITLLPYKTYSDIKTIKLVPEIEIVKVVDLPRAKPSDTLNFSINVKNNGARDDNVQINDKLSNLLDLTSLKIKELNGEVITWNLGTLQHGESKTVAFSIKIKDSAKNLEIVNNKATYKSDTGTKETNETVTIIDRPPVVVKVIDPEPPLLAETGKNNLLSVVVGTLLIFLVIAMNFIPRKVYGVVKNMSVRILYLFCKYKVAAFILIFATLAFGIFPDAAYAATDSMKSDLAPFWKGMKALINAMRYLVGGIAVIAIIFIGIQKIISLFIPGEEVSTSNKLIGLVIGIGIVLFSPEIIKAVAEVFDKKIELPL